jgi:hypothetical protein
MNFSSSEHPEEKRIEESGRKGKKQKGKAIELN